MRFEEAISHHLRRVPYKILMKEAAFQVVLAEGQMDGGEAQASADPFIRKTLARPS